MKRALVLAVLAACGDNAEPPIAQLHSSSIALSPDGAQLFVVNPDSDSISIIDTKESALVAEVALGVAPRVVAGAFTPAVLPRALVVAPDGATVYVTGERAGALFAVDVASQRVRSVAVCSEPHGVLASTDRVFVACTQDASVVAVDMATFEVADRVAVAAMPWALAWSDDGSLVVTHFQGPGVTALDPATLAVRGGITLPDVPNPGDDPRLAHGVIRGLYDAAFRPGTSELWLPHLLLAIDTPQPRLDFETTVFPAVTIARADGFRVTLSNDTLDIPGTDGAFADVVSGPHAIAFTRDGALALVVDTNSEDVLAIDAGGRVQAALLRPLPGHMPEGIAIATSDELAYIDQRNTGDIAVVRIDRMARTGGPVALTVAGRIPRLAADPMPAAMRLGQHLFYSANSDEYPITRNHWVACASCHLEGRSDGVTWRFEQGPRDTPTNAGGTIGTGFLFRTADRTRVQDYWHTIAVEQGGAFDPIADAPLLDALAAYVDHAIPPPVPPTTDPALVAAGKAIFERADVGCASCHDGPALTDSGTGNPGLDLAGTVLLHDVGTCVSDGDFPDVAHADIAGHPREPCLFDTPSLRGIAASPPYLHDGSAPTLRAVLEQTRGTMGNITTLSPADLDALVEYMRSL